MTGFFGTKATDSGLSATFFTSVTKGAAELAGSAYFSVAFSHFESMHSVFDEVKFG